MIDRPRKGPLTNGPYRLICGSFQPFNPKSLPISVSTPFSASLLPPSVSFKLHSSSVSLSLFAPSPAKSNSAASRFVRNVAVTEDSGVDEGGIFSDEPAPQQEQSFSADLKLFVGNLPFDVDSAQLAQLFESVGNVEMVEVIYDKITGRSRGFGFVTMSSVSEVEAAAQQFNGYVRKIPKCLRVHMGNPFPKTLETPDLPFSSPLLSILRELESLLLLLLPARPGC